MSKVFGICLIILFNFSSCGILDFISNDANSSDSNSPNAINVPSDIICQWKLESVRININGGFMTIVNNDKIPTLGISENGHIGGYDGCSEYSGQIFIDNSRNIIFSNLLSTHRGCPPDVYWHDNFYEALGRINNYMVQDNKLLLKKDSHILMILSKINTIRCGNERKNDK